MLWKYKALWLFGAILALVGANMFSFSFWPEWLNKDWENNNLRSQEGLLISFGVVTVGLLVLAFHWVGRGSDGCSGGVEPRSVRLIAEEINLLPENNCHILARGIMRLIRLYATRYTCHGVIAAGMKPYRNRKTKLLYNSNDEVEICPIGNG